MPTDIATLGIKIEASDIRTAVKELDRLEDQAKKTEGKVQKLRKGFSGLGTVIAALGIGLLTKKLIDNINVYQSLTNQLKLVTNGAEDLKNVQTDLFEIAQDSRVSLEGTIDLYARLARSTKSLKLSNDELLDVTESVNQAVAISGSSAASAQAALFQFGQGLAADALRGQELNSIMEQTPRLAQAIADGLGIELGQLREVAAQGELTAAVVTKALQNQADTLKTEFSGMEKTVGQAFQQIENVALQTFGSMDATDLVKSMDELRAILSDPDIVSGLQSMASLMLEIVNLGIKAAAGWGMIFELFTDGTLTEQIRDARNEMKGISDEIKKAAKEGRPYESLLLDLADATDAYNKLTASIVKNKKAESGDPSTTGVAEVSDEELSQLAIALQHNDELIAADQELYRIKEENRLNDANLQEMARSLEILNAEEHARQKQEIERQSNAIILSSSQGLYSALSGLIKASGTENKGIQLAMLAFEKGLAIAQSIINTQVAVTKALSVDPTGILAARVGIMGNIATGLIAATAVAQAGNIGQAHDGMDKIPATGSYVLEKGEMVLDKGTSEQVRNGVAGGTTNIYLSAIDTQSGMEFLQKNGETIFNTQSQQMYENGLNYG